MRKLFNRKNLVRVLVIVAVLLLVAFVFKDSVLYQLLKISTVVGVSFDYVGETQFNEIGVLSEYPDIVSPPQVEDPSFEKLVVQALAISSKYLEPGVGVRVEDDLLVIDKPVNKSMCMGYAVLFKAVFDKQAARYGIDVKTAVVYGTGRIPGVLSGGHYWIRIEHEGKTRWVDPSLHDRIGLIFIDPIVKAE